MMFSVGNRTSMAADARAATVLTAVPPRASPDVDGRAEVVIGQPVQALDLVGKRLDRADPLHVRRARMSGAPGYLQLYKSGSLAPRDEIAVRPPGLGIEHCARVLCLGLDNRPRGRGGDLLVRGEETGQRARRAKAMGILDLAYSNLAIRLQQVVVRKAVRRVAGKSGDGKKRRARRRGSVVARFGGIRGGQECLTEADYIHWQHGRMQDYDWPQRVEIAIADEREVAGYREGAQRQHALGTEGGKDQA